MSAREELVAYLATLGSIVLIVLGAMLIGALSGLVLGKLDAFGLGTVLGGLIGVLRIPTRRNPLGATEQGDVNITPASGTTTEGTENV